MPSAYAHYRLGFRTLATLPPEAASLIRRNRQMFDLGLHGPDFLFYYHPFAGHKLGRLGSAIHSQTGREFFGRAARLLKLQPDEAAESYLFGVLAHFALDSQCHPFVEQMAGEESGHIEIETEFDRYLLSVDGRPHPHRERIYRHIRLDNKADAARIARFYPGVTEKQVRTSFSNMAWMGSMLTSPSQVVRGVIGSGRLGNTANESLMMPSPNPRCAGLNEPLMERFYRTERLYPVLARGLWDHLHHGAKLGPEFDGVFG